VPSASIVVKLSTEAGWACPCPAKAAGKVRRETRSRRVMDSILTHRQVRGSGCLADRLCRSANPRYAEMASLLVAYLVY
jgi:hypothetical protein